MAKTKPKKDEPTKASRIAALTRKHAVLKEAAEAHSLRARRVGAHAEHMVKQAEAAQADAEEALKTAERTRDQLADVETELVALKGN